MICLIESQADDHLGPAAGLLGAGGKFPGHFHDHAARDAGKPFLPGRGAGNRIVVAGGHMVDRKSVV